MLIKVCGMTRADNIRAVERLGIDLMGFIFYPKSPRRVREVPAYLPTRAKRVGVFVDESREQILATARLYGLHYIQLHGNESPDLCRSLRSEGLKLIKAFSIAQPEDITATSAYDGLCDLYLFDTKTPAYGGSGAQFDWGILRAYEGATPFLLSGGISPDSATALSQFRHSRMAGIDLNSRFELSPGIKDTALIAQFYKSYKTHKSYNL